MELSHRNAILVVVVAALAATAGCTGGNGPGTATANNSTDGQTIEPMEQLNGSELTNATSAAAEDGGSYTVETDSYVLTNSSLGQSEGVTNTTTRVDFAADRGIRVSNQTSFGSPTGNGSIVVYTDGNTSYQRINSSRGVSYSVQTGTGFQIQPVNTTAYTQNYTGLTDAFEYEANGTTTVDGTTVVRYDSTNLTDASVFVGTNSNATVSNSSNTLYVDDDGVVRRVDLSYTVSSEAGSSRIDLTSTLTDVGSTSVEEPGWLDEAQNSTTETAS